MWAQLCVCLTPHYCILLHLLCINLWLVKAKSRESGDICYLSEPPGAPVTVVQ